MGWGGVGWGADQSLSAKALQSVDHGRVPMANPAGAMMGPLEKARKGGGEAGAYGTLLQRGTSKKERLGLMAPLLQRETS